MADDFVLTSQSVFNMSCSSERVGEMGRKYPYNLYFIVYYFDDLL